jgi:peptide/nickel transport system permease protein
VRNYIIRRVAHSVLILGGLMALLFFATNILGDPVELLVGDDAVQEVVDALRRKYGLDRPLHIRFADFYWKLLQGDFDRSIRLHIEARSLVFERLPNTAVLAAAAWGIGMIGIPIGMLAARRPRGIMDRFVNVLTFAIISIPDFWLALMLVLLIAVQFELLPTSGFDGFGLSGWKYIVLPALALSPRVLGRNAQITRATMIEELGKQYVATARSKGLAEGVILQTHVLKNAAISIVTLMGDELAGFMNGATIVEVVFGWPGLGALLIDAINARDLPVITATVFVVALMVMAINLAVDMVYTYLDPRIQYK